MSEPSRMSNPGVQFPPPLLFVAGFALGWLIDRRVMRASVPYSDSTIVTTAGLLLALLGLALMISGMVTFARAHTAIIPNRPASQLVERGPYRFTRNPMYTGLTFAYVGGVLLTGSVWPLIFLPLILVLLVRLVIRREEAYLSAAFGAEYTAYQSRVRRWL